MRCRINVAAMLVLAAVAGASGVGAQAGAQKPGKQADEQKPAAADRLTADTLSGLEFRSIGPATTSGRVSDIAVDPRATSTYYVATASGGVWKTVNDGTSWTPLFDAQGSFSIGCVTIDPHDPFTVWVGTGENNSQRSVSYGDGVYRSRDGGATWENLGLKDSMHIGMIAVDPRDSSAVYVAAMGPLWSAGGDRGLYKTTDGGRTWKAVLTISENTGVNEVHLDPRNADVVYATSYQRRRHVWTLVDGGPESTIYKSTDAGATWRKIDSGLPAVDKGRIGLAIAPAAPDTVYAIVEAATDKGGFFRSTNRGETWEKMSDYVSGGPQYYNEIVPDPKSPDRVYSLDTYLMVTDDGGKTFHQAGEKFKHVDNHALWIDPADTGHLLNGNDGGVYESFDRAATWQFKANLPVTQFYRIALDNAAPFYNVYGGTQDNTTLGGPSRTTTQHGITNEMWFVTTGGDGFQPRVDPNDPNIVYSESQHGGLVRFDRRTGEQIDIQPQPGPGDPPLRWNWDSPILISPHSPTRLYFAAQRVFRSDDRGDSWKSVSPDLTRQLDRNAMKIMGRVWSIDAVAKNSSTSFYGNIVSLSESPLKEGLLYAGTDDGLVQVSEDGGATWRKQDKFSGVPDLTYVSRLEASRHNADVVYAAFDNHKMGDLKPYLLKSTDRGRTWTSIASNLPARGSVYVVIEDSVVPDLLFAGTEFGLFTSPDGGRRWLQMKGGLPTIAVRDLAVQARENDLAVATFGRGFYILDDLAPLRAMSPARLEQAGGLFPVRRAWMYIPAQPLGLRDKSFFGESFYTAPNPPFGAVFAYYLRDDLKSKRESRRDAEKKIEKAGGDQTYPSWTDLRAEARELAPAVVLTVTDEEGNIVRRLTGPTSAGVHRVAWDLRYPPASPATLAPPSDDPFSDPPTGPLAAPGKYRVSLAQRVDGVETPLGEPQTFEAAALGTASIPNADRAGLLAFERQTARLQRAVLGASRLVREELDRMPLIRKAIADTPGADARLMADARSIEDALRTLQVALDGDSVVARASEPTLPGIVDRVQRIVGGQWVSTSAPTGTNREAYRIASESFAPVLERLRTVVDVDLKGLFDRMEAAGSPWTPGRVPKWAPDAGRR